MCVNDVLAQGAEPLFFLDYFSCGSLNVDVAAAVVGGIAKACKIAGCALLGEDVELILGNICSNLDLLTSYTSLGFQVAKRQKCQEFTVQENMTWRGSASEQ